MRLLVLFSIVLTALGTSAQRYAFIAYGPDQGLPQSQVRCLESTDDGWLWVGTNEGLSRFDGKEFHVVPALKTAQINTLWKDGDGRLYVGFSGGVAVRQGQQFVLIPVRTEEVDAEVRQLSKSADGTLWIGTASQGVWTWKDGQLAKPSQIQKGVPSWIPPLQECRGLITGPGAWFGADKQNVYRYSPDAPIGTETVIYSALTGAVQNLFRHSDGTLWMATVGGGVVQVTDFSQRRFDASNGYVSNDARHFFEDRDQNLWISSRYGVSRWNGKEFLNFRPENGLPTEQINCVTQDYEGNIWLGTQGKGLLLFTGQDLTTFTVQEGLPSDLVMNIAQDAAGDVWVSTYDAGAIKLSGDEPSGQEFTVPGGSNRVWCSLLDRRGAMWFGTSNGLWRFENDVWTSFGKEDGLHSRVILSLFEDETGRLWIGSYRGINWLENDGEITSFPYADSYEWKKIRSIRKDENSTVWCAGSLGIFEVKGEQVRHWTQDDGLPDLSCSAALPAQDGTVWISSQAGLARLQGDSIVAFQSEDVQGHINFTVEWQGRLWVGTNNGVLHVPLQGLSPQTRFERLGTRDGLGSRETNQNAWMIDDQERLWIGTVEGLNRLEPALAERSQNQVPKLALREVRLNLLPTPWAERGVALDPETNLPQNLEVGHQDNHFTFQYRGFGLRYPQSLEYQYRLLGFDDDWRPVTDAEFATYSNLPFRAFEFQVRARLGNGGWSDVQSFNFQVNPPFWMTWWFYLLEAIAAIALIWFIFDRRRRMVTAKLEKEKFELKSRMLALEQQNLNASMNRHFVFNALNSIQYYINRKDRIAANKYLSAFARLIRKNLDSSADNVTSLRDEMERLELYLQLEHMRFQDKFAYGIHIDPELDADDIQVPSMLLQPFLENSIWHGILPKNAPGRVDIHVAREQAGIAVIIRDDGIGIDTSLAQKNEGEDHVSKGMSITSSRLEVMRKMTQENLQLIGPYELKDADNHVLGTEVKIILPLSFGEISVN